MGGAAEHLAGLGEDRAERLAPVGGIGEGDLVDGPQGGVEETRVEVGRGPLARLFWGGAAGVGGVLALCALGLFARTGLEPLAVLAAALALAGLLTYEHAWVRAGQSVQLS
jgi:hypothetical protein